MNRFAIVSHCRAFFRGEVFWGSVIRLASALSLATAVLSGCVSQQQHEDRNRKQPAVVGPTTNAQAYFVTSAQSAGNMFDTASDKQSYALLFLETYRNPHGGGWKGYYPAFSVKVSNFQGYSDEDYKIVFGVPRDQSVI